MELSELIEQVRKDAREMRRRANENSIQAMSLRLIDRKASGWLRAIAAHQGELAMGLEAFADYLEQRAEIR